MPPKKDSPPLEETFAVMAENFSKLLTATNANTEKLDLIVKQLMVQYEQTNTLIANTTKPENITPPPPPPPPNNQIRPPKLTLPAFNGTNPLDWLFQADQYFTFHNIGPPQRLSMVAFHLTGDALSWYKYLFNNRLLTTWDAFTRALETRFGPSTYDNHQAALFKLRQTSTVTAYQTEFERLSNCVVGLPPEALLNCFLSGLRDDIQQELTILRPQTITQAIGLAKLIEDKLNDQTFDHSNTATTSQLTPTTQPLLDNPSPTLPIKKLTPVEMQKRRADGLCFNFTENYHSGHKCNPPKFLLLQSGYEPNAATTDPPWGLSTINYANLGLEDKAYFREGRIDT